MFKPSISRRNAMTTMAAAGVAAAIPIPGESTMAEASENNVMKLKGNIKHSASLWCYNKVSKEKFLEACKAFGLVGVDLVGNRDDWELMKKYDLIPTMVPGAGGISNGLNNKNDHKKFMDEFKDNITAASKAGLRNVITFSGERKGMSDEVGMDNCELILKEAVKIAEDHDIVINMELLNSRVDHPDYMCDKSAWGIELCKRVNSPAFKLLFDIYHMQIMEGDIIRTIRNHHEHFGHYHTGGVPGRNEIDETQEIYYPAIMREIVKTGYDGYVAQEFVPSRDPLESLKQSILICDV